jgi:hypothetical protein
MPIAPQITNTPVDITSADFAITAVSYTSSAATYTASGHTFNAGDTVIISGIVPAGYSGTFTVSSVVAGTSFTCANTTNLAVTTATGDAFSANATDFTYSDVAQVRSADIVDVNSAFATSQASAAAALAAANTAQTTATTALANASTAYSAAIGSLQPSASTIVNSSNQITAIASNGITVYSGSSATSGARVVMNSVGLAGYDASNNATFSITASTGAANFSGSITGSTITGSQLNIGGNFYVDGSTGLLQARDVTLLGNITATSATITGKIVASDTSTLAGWTLSGTKIQANSGSTYLDSSTGKIATIGDITAGGSISTGTGNISSAAGFVTLSSISGGTISATTTLSSGGLATLSSLSITNTASIVGGYGITTDWSPNTDNTYNLGISGSRRWSHVYANNTTITTSDARLKTNVVDSPLGLTFIDSLRPVAYQWIEGSKKIVLDDNEKPIIIGEDAQKKPIYETVSVPGKRIHYGLIAQEVKSALDAANVGDFAGWVQDDISNPDSYQSISYEQFISPLIKAVQELSAKVSALEGK